jgi:hypothetical protein
MYVLLLIVSFLGSLLAISSKFSGSLSEIKKNINKLIPYQGWIGIGLLFFSIKSFSNLSSAYLYLKIYLLAFTRFIIGFILAYNLLKQNFFANNLDFIQKAQKFRLQLEKIQFFAGVILLIYTLIAIYKYIKILILYYV